MKGLAVGQQARVTRTFTADDLAEYAALAGLPRPPAALPGPLLGGLFSYLLGTRLPGRGTNYLKQRIVFRAPAFAGEVLTAAVEVVRLRPDKQLVNLRTWCSNAAGHLVCDGEALVLVSDVAAAPAAVQGGDAR